eukprot:2623390-Rhodomonas_salina.1
MAAALSPAGCLARHNLKPQGQNGSAGGADQHLCTSAAASAATALPAAVTPFVQVFSVPAARTSAASQTAMTLFVFPTPAACSLAASSAATPQFVFSVPACGTSTVHTWSFTYISLFSLN